VIDISRFRVDEGHAVNLKKWPTHVKRFYDSTSQYESLLAARVKELSERQNLLYADNRYAVLVIFQAMDAAGKDGTIGHVLSGVNPQGCQVFSFQQPSAQELDHDFLWRTTQCLPERGRIGIFNRSYYEEVLVVRVHPELLIKQRIPDQPAANRTFWKHRYESIVDLERHLHRNGTRIVKFFLHLSKQEQRQRFLARIDNPQKNWKFNGGDLTERDRWKDYMAAYQDCLEATSTDKAPWYVVPADDKENARLIVAEVLVKTMARLKMHYPAPDRQRLEELRGLRKKLV
jgi:PPK2 family polyphosphate:nucleotide phosphotransferase